MRSSARRCSISDDLLQVPILFCKLPVQALTCYSRSTERLFLKFGAESSGLGFLLFVAENGLIAGARNQQTVENEAVRNKPR